LADAIDVQLVFDKDMAGATNEHVLSAALTAKLLLVAAHAHRGSANSFVEMSARAFEMMVAGRTMLRLDGEGSSIQ
jgi:hypothetical protein